MELVGTNRQIWTILHLDDSGMSRCRQLQAWVGLWIHHKISQVRLHTPLDILCICEIGSVSNYWKSIAKAIYARVRSWSSCHCLSIESIVLDGCKPNVVFPTISEAWLDFSIFIHDSFWSRPWSGRGADCSWVPGIKPEACINQSCMSGMVVTSHLKGMMIYVYII